VDVVEAHWSGIHGAPVSKLLGNLYAVVDQSRGDLSRSGLKQVLKEIPGSLPVSSCKKLSDGELGCPVASNEQIKPPFGVLSCSPKIGQ
jgi:hypothetical protein